MKIKVQYCYCGNGVFKYRALVCGGLLVRADKWTKETATRMLDLVSIETGLKRSNIRFIHT